MTVWPFSKRLNIVGTPCESYGASYSNEEIAEMFSEPEKKISDMTADELLEDFHLTIQQWQDGETNLMAVIDHISSALQEYFDPDEF